MSVEQQIALLESARGQLVRQRGLVENKIAEVKEKAKRREEVERERLERRRKLGSGAAMK
jgi:hypothetical protein